MVDSVYIVTFGPTDSIVGVHSSQPAAARDAKRRAIAAGHSVGEDRLSHEASMRSATRRTLPRHSGPAYSVARVDGPRAATLRVGMGARTVTALFVADYWANAVEREGGAVGFFALPHAAADLAPEVDSIAADDSASMTEHAATCGEWAARDDRAKGEAMGAAFHVAAQRVIAPQDIAAFTQAYDSILPPASNPPSLPLPCAQPPAPESTMPPVVVAVEVETESGRFRVTLANGKASEVAKVYPGYVLPPYKVEWCDPFGPYVAAARKAESAQ